MAWFFREIFEVETMACFKGKAMDSSHRNGFNLGPNPIWRRDLRLGDPIPLSDK
jgi:hypothetical protein